ncbi:PTS ascorbate transporter subunit IIA [Telmatospirillum sp.]|uniref:PTS ascorbate transporter subunit IIA n=1 Tax=Telmatospirillum sp. TaxID=2079197 RepID=UPI002841FF1A|nr:PTS ascorbate transporter subunit IIA [Telmatospirillum sp.]MDR3440022.1 PTS ascorbate transporter subunit IIA [Telmatospirillum sp.]
MNLIEHLLTTDAIRLKAKADDWKEAVRLGVDLLVAADSVEPRYFDAIIAMTESLGPWYLLAPGLAMPHARPEEGVKKDGFALVTLDRPVAFGSPDNDPIDILITLAATSAKTMNEESIVQVATLFDDEERVARIRNARNHAEIERILGDI